MCNEPGYRQYVIQNMPQLIKLDDVTITEEERRTFGVSQSVRCHKHISEMKLDVIENLFV